jgi:hypothetical protein
VLDEGLRALNRALGISTVLLEPGLVRSTATEQTLASAMAVRAPLQTNGCAQVTRMGPEVTVGFNQGCTLGSARMVAAGTMVATARISAAGTLSAQVKLSTIVDGKSALDGTLGIDLLQGDVLGFSADLTLEATSVAVPSMAATVASFSGQIPLAVGTLDGPGLPVLDGGGSARALELESVAESFDGCAPREGKVRFDGLTVTFDSTSPQTRIATVTDAAGTRKLLLPARPGCGS